MRSERALMILVAADVVLAFSMVGTEFAFQWTLPPALRTYAMNQVLWRATSPWDLSLILLFATSILCTFAAWVSLLNLWRLGRRLYVVGWFTWTLWEVLSGPTVLTAAGTMIMTLESLVGGAIIGVLYFSDASRHFERRGVPIDAGVGATT